jgi:hypothetical protein
MAGNYLLLHQTGALQLHQGGYVLLADQTVTEPIVIVFQNEAWTPEVLFEETTGLFDGELVDESNVQVALSTIDSLVLTVTDKGSDTVIRQEECLNANDVTVTEGATITTIQWEPQPDDTKIITRANGTERRVITFQSSHNAGTSNSGAGLFDTVSGSSTVTVTLGGHGLTVGSTGHNVFLNAGSAVDGLTLRGGYLITAVIDANDVEIDAHSDATGTTVGGGGTTAWWLNGRVNKAVYERAIRRDEPIGA